MLQAVSDKYRKQKVTLLPVSMDEPEDRPKIPEFLKKHGITARTLVVAQDELGGFETQVASSLYLLDRQGVLAGVPSDFYFDIERQVEARLPELIEGKPSKGAMLWAIDEAPPGFGIRWRREAGALAQGVLVAPAPPGGHPEIAVASEEAVKRFSSSGELIGEVPLEGKENYIQTALDLDGDGRIEWLNLGKRSARLLGPEGKAFWGIYSRSPDAGDYSLQPVAFPDLNGDGRREVLVKDGPALAAYDYLGQPLWRNERLEGLQSARVDPAGTIWAELGKGWQRIDASGRPQGGVRRENGPGQLRGWTTDGAGRRLEIRDAQWVAEVDARHDLDGDGKADILVPDRGGLGVYRTDGTRIASIRVNESQEPVHAAMANLDDRPGDELILFVPRYGLVVMGMEAGRAAGN